MPLNRQGFINETEQVVTSLVASIIGLRLSNQFILYWSSYRMELLPMKTCERFERRLDQLRMGARQSRKPRQSPELLPMNNLRPLERRFDHPLEQP